jgi:hypothetical protein
MRPLLAALAALTLAFAPAPFPRPSRKPAPKLVGVWRLLKTKAGDHAWEDRHTHWLELKTITPTHFTWTVRVAGSKVVRHGATGRCSIKGNAYVENVEAAIGSVDPSVVGQVMTCTWRLMGRELHMEVYNRGIHYKQVWVPAD